MKLKLIIFFIIYLVTTNCYAQPIIQPSDTSDHLLWYSGKLIAKNKLKLPGGGSVSYDPSSGNVDVSFPPNSDPLQDKLNKQILSEQPSGINYAFAQSYNQAFEKTDQEYNDILNKSQDNLSGNTPSSPQQQEQNFVQGMLSQGCPTMKAEFDAIMAFYNAHRHDDPNLFNLPEPPRQDYDNCWSCFPHKETEYDTLVAHYMKDVCKPESDMIEKGLGIEKTMALLGLQIQFDNGGSGLGNLDDQLYGSKSHPTSCSWLLGCEYDLKNALDFLVYREVEKGEYLFKKYRKDYYHLTAANRVWLSALRNYSLYSGNSSTGDVAIAEIGGALGAFEYNYFNRIFGKDDWTQLPNISFLIELMREHELLGGAEGHELEKFLNADRFKMSIDVDCKMGANGEYQLAHINGDNYIRFFSVDSPQCVGSSVIIGPASENKGTNTLGLKLQATEFVVPQDKAQFTYEGTKDWYSLIPDFRFHACNTDGSDKDTIIVHQLIPKGNQETWLMKAPMMSQVMYINYTQPVAFVQYRY